MKRNLESRKKYFKKQLLINVQQNILARRMEWLRDAKNRIKLVPALLGPSNMNAYTTFIQNSPGSLVDKHETTAYYITK